MKAILTDILVRARGISVQEAEACLSQATLQYPTGKDQDIHDSKACKRCEHDSPMQYKECDHVNLKLYSSSELNIVDYDRYYSELHPDGDKEEQCDLVITDNQSEDKTLMLCDLKYAKEKNLGKRQKKAFEQATETIKEWLHFRSEEVLLNSFPNRVLLMAWRDPDVVIIPDSPLEALGGFINSDISKQIGLAYCPGPNFHQFIRMRIKYDDVLNWQNVIAFAKEKQKEKQKKQ